MRHVSVTNTGICSRVHCFLLKRSEADKPRKQTIPKIYHHSLVNAPNHNPLACTPFLSSWHPWIVLKNKLTMRECYKKTWLIWSMPRNESYEENLTNSKFTSKIITTKIIKQFSNSHDHNVSIRDSYCFTLKGFMVHVKLIVIDHSAWCNPTLLHYCEYYIKEMIHHLIINTVSAISVLSDTLKLQPNAKCHSTNI